MSSNNTTFLDVDTGDTARRIASLQTSGSGDDRPGLFWLSGFNSTMSGTKATDLTEWAVADGLAMTRFDYSGHGESSGRFEDGNISLWLDEANTVLNEMTSDPQILIGSSMGGWLALLMAEAINAETPGRIAGLVMIAPAWDMTERLMWDVLPQDVRQIMQRDGVWQRPSEYSDNNYPITMQLIEDGRKHLFKNRTIKTGCPVRILHGLEDPDVPWQGSQTLIKQLETDNAHLTLIKEGGHRLSEPQHISALKYAVAELTG